MTPDPPPIVGQALKRGHNSYLELMIAKKIDCH